MLIYEGVSMRHLSILPLVVGAVFAIDSFSHGLPAQDLNTQREALKVIQDFVDGLCALPKDVSIGKGQKDKLELSGTAKARLDGMLKKLAELGIEGSAKYASENWKGPLQSDVADLIKDNQKCRLKLWDDLKDRLLPKETVPKKTEIPRIKTIHTTYYDPQNKIIIDLLESRDGSKVYLDTVNADLTVEENYKIVKACFSGGESAIDGSFAGKLFPIPTTDDSKTDNCQFYFEIESADKRSYPLSSGGTGVVNFLIRKTFLVNLIHSGFISVFNLREVP